MRFAVFSTPFHYLPTEARELRLLVYLPSGRQNAPQSPVLAYLPTFLGVYGMRIGEKLLMSNAQKLRGAGFCD